MERPFNLANEAARHPFRRRLPPVVLPKRERRDDEDWKLFVLSFVAFFICFYTFLL